MQKIGIIGAGISGLSLAWFLKKAYGNEIDITILEKQNRIGGWIQTSNNDGFLFEQGPRGCRTKGKGLHTLQLIEDLNLQDSVIGADESSHLRYLYIDQQLQQLPSSFFSFLTSSLLKGIVPSLLKEPFIAKSTLEDESIYDFASRRLGSDIANRFFDPITFGIFAGNIRELSMRSCFPSIYEHEKSYGSIVKGMLFAKKQDSVKPTTDFQHSMQKHALFSFKDGMKTLPERLAEMTDCHILLNMDIESITNNVQGIEVIVKNDKFQFDHLFSTVAPSSLKSLLPNQAHLLNAIPSKSIGLVNLGYDTNVLSRKGFGYLIPSQENEKILGMTWDSCTFPQQNQGVIQTRLTVMMDMHNDLESIALEAAMRHIGIKSPPNFIQKSHITEAIPQYLVGHQGQVIKIQSEIEKSYPNLTLLGTGYYGVGVNDCVHSAFNISQNFCKKIGKRNTIGINRTL